MFFFYKRQVYSYNKTEQPKGEGWEGAFKHVERKKCVYQEVTSSSANNTPPTGALKAAATPAAHPQVTFQNVNPKKKERERENQVFAFTTIDS